MAKKTLKTPKQLSRQIRTDVESSFQDKKMWDKVGKESVSLIKGTMVQGKGVTSERGSSKSFKKVSPGYAKYRKPTSSLAPKRGDKSKLISSGRMHGDMSHSAFKGKTSIGFVTERSAEIAKAHDKDGVGKSKVKRPFFNLSKAQFNLLNRLMKLFVDANLKK